MPVVFKDVKPEKITIEKDGTLFYFQIDEGKRKSARLNFLIDPERDIGKIMIDHFRKALTGWDNLLNEDNDPVPFSIAVRDTLVNCMEVFNEEDVLGVLNPDSKKKTSTENQTSTSESASVKQSSCTGSRKGAKGATTTQVVKSPEESV
jgi:hypothetical protein